MKLKYIIVLLFTGTLLNAQNNKSNLGVYTADMYYDEASKEWKASTNNQIRENTAPLATNQGFNGQQQYSQAYNGGQNVSQNSQYYNNRVQPNPVEQPVVPQYYNQNQNVAAQQPYTQTYNGNQNVIQNPQYNNNRVQPNPVEQAVVPQYYNQNYVGQQPYNHAYNGNQNASQYPQYSNSRVQPSQVEQPVVSQYYNQSQNFGVQQPYAQAYNENPYVNQYPQYSNNGGQYNQVEQPVVPQYYNQNQNVATQQPYNQAYNEIPYVIQNPQYNNNRVQPNQVESPVVPQYYNQNQKSENSTITPEDPDMYNYLFKNILENKKDAKLSNIDNVIYFPEGFSMSLPNNKYNITREKGKYIFHQKDFPDETANFEIYVTDFDLQESLSDNGHFLVSKNNNLGLYGIYSIDKQTDQRKILGFRLFYTLPIDNNKYVTARSTLFKNYEDSKLYVKDVVNLNYGNLYYTSN